MKTLMMMLIGMAVLMAMTPVALAKKGDLATCSNGKDDDGDGYVDCRDFDNCGHLAHCQALYKSLAEKGTPLEGAPLVGDPTTVPETPAVKLQTPSITASDLAKMKAELEAAIKAGPEVESWSLCTQLPPEQQSNCLAVLGGMGVTVPDSVVKGATIMANKTGKVPFARSEVTIPGLGTAKLQFGQPTPAVVSVPQVGAWPEDLMKDGNSGLPHWVALPVGIGAAAATVGTVHALGGDKTDMAVSGISVGLGTAAISLLVSELTSD